MLKGCHASHLFAAVGLKTLYDWNGMCDLQATRAVLPRDFGPMMCFQFPYGPATHSAMTPELGTLQAFVAVADCGGFAEAAQRMGLSASIVSRRVAALEQQLNVHLLVRTTRGMALTEPGARFHALSRELLAGLALACEEVREDTDSVAGLVRVTAPQSLLGVALVAPVVANLLSRYPGLRFDLSLDERKLDLVSGAIDVAVRVGPVPDSRSFARRLAVLEGRLVASPEYLARHGTPRSAAELSAHVSLEHTELGPQGLWRMEDAEPPRQLVRANSFEVIQQLARAGAGLAVMPSFAVRDDLDRGALCLLLPHWQSPPFELFAVAPPAARLSARARLVMDALSAQAEVAFGDTGPRP
jgi:DNA-binding transcriptional LysR family regulator